jgi:hypothetical protein
MHQLGDAFADGQQTFGTQLHQTHATRLSLHKVTSLNGRNWKGFRGDFGGIMI